MRPETSLQSPISSQCSHPSIFFSQRIPASSSMLHLNPLASLIERQRAVGRSEVKVAMSQSHLQQSDLGYLFPRSPAVRFQSLRRSPAVRSQLSLRRSCSCRFSATNRLPIGSRPLTQPHRCPSFKCLVLVSLVVWVER